MTATNSVSIEGVVGARITHYPAREAEKGGKGKKEFLCFDIWTASGWIQIQAYEVQARKALKDGIKEGRRVFVAGLLRCTEKRGRCGQFHRFVNVVAGRIEVLAPSRGRPEFTDEESLGEPPRVF